MNTNYSIGGAQKNRSPRSSSQNAGVTARLLGMVFSLVLALGAVSIPLQSFAQCIGAACTGTGTAPPATGVPTTGTAINFTSPTANSLSGGLTAGQIAGGGLSGIRGIFRTALRFLPNNRIRVGPINITDDAGAAMTGIESQACRILQLLGIEGDGNSGAFGALAMTVSGLIAVLSAALGSYRVALGTLVVGIGSMIMESMVELFFGDIECDFLFNLTV